MIIKNGFYIIEDGQPYGPDNIIWDSPSMSTAMQGGAFRLPNGNTLVTDCDDAIIKEFTKPVFSSEDDDGYTNAGLEDDTGGDNDVVYDVKDYTQLNKIKGSEV